MVTTDAVLDKLSLLQQISKAPGTWSIFTNLVKALLYVSNRNEVHIHVKETILISSFSQGL